MLLLTFLKVQRSPLFCANIVKKDPGRARQNSLATAGTNFTKPGAQNKGDLCSCIRFTIPNLLNHFKLLELLPQPMTRYLVKGAILLQRPELMHMFRAGQSAIEQYMNHDDWYSINFPQEKFESIQLTRSHFSGTFGSP